MVNLGVRACFGVALLLIIKGIHTSRKSRFSQSWPTTTGTILSSSVEYHADDHPSYENSIYEYVIDGTRISSDHIDYGNPRRTEPEAKSLAAQFPVGQMIQIYYDPANPRIAVLRHSGSRHGLWLTVLGLTVLLCSFLSLWLGPGTIQSW